MSWAPAGHGLGRMDGTHVGYSGTKRGMRDNSLNLLSTMLTEIKLVSRGPMWLHHGDCVGGDQQAHVIARRLGYRIYLHPPNVNNHRAFCDYDYADPIMEYLQRNEEIARWSRERLIGCPSQFHEVIRSGTWSTVRRALKHGRRVVLIDAHQPREYTESKVIE